MNFLLYRGLVITPANNYCFIKANNRTEMKEVLFLLWTFYHLGHSKESLLISTIRELNKSFDCIVANSNLIMDEDLAELACKAQQYRQVFIGEDDRTNCLTFMDNKSLKNLAGTDKYFFNIKYEDWSSVKVAIKIGELDLIILNETNGQIKGESSSLSHVKVKHAKL